MSVDDCYSCRERQDRIREMGALVSRYKMDRDEALSMCETLRARIRATTDATTYHDRIEQEMFSRLATTQKELEKSREELKAAQINAGQDRTKIELVSKDLGVVRQEVVEATKECRRLQALAKEHERKAGDLRFKLHEHEKLPIVRRVWPESRLEHFFARLAVEVCFMWRAGLHTLYWSAFLLLMLTPGIAALILLLVRKSP
jgi:hypothetical protein